MGILERYVGVISCIVGLLALVFAQRELSRPASSSELEQLTLLDVEEGKRPTREYVELGPYLSLPEEGVLIPVIPEASRENSKRNAHTAIRTFFFPVTHMAQGMAAFEPKKDLDFKILVKTHRFSTLAEARDMWPAGASLTGLIINRVDPLNAEERAAIQAAYPKLNIDSLLVLEQGRKPHSHTPGTALAVLGSILVLLPLGALGKRLLVRPKAPASVGEDAALEPLELVPVAPTPSVAPPPVASYPPPSGGQSARFAVGARVHISRGNSSYPGSVAASQAGQVQVVLDDGRKVWVAADSVVESAS